MIIDYNICSQSKAPDPMDWELYYVLIVVNWRRYVARGSRLATFEDIMLHVGYVLQFLGVLLPFLTKRVNNSSLIVTSCQTCQ